MTGFSIEKVPFEADEVRIWGAANPRHRNWPVVYIINDDAEVYVGESLNAEVRMQQHLGSPDKGHLNWSRVILDETFNKSACLDLESYLIRMFSGDGRLRVINHTAGITDANYFDRDGYQQTFLDVFEKLRTQEHLFQRTIPEIVNSDLFKLSPFKALNHDQAIAVGEILDGIFAALEEGRTSTAVVQGDPGTGKTVVGIYLLKLLDDIRQHDAEETLDGDLIFAEYFTPRHAELLTSLRVGLVVPQQSLRETVSRVFDLTPGLRGIPVMTPFTVGESAEPFDLLIVDEAHRLNQRANQSSASLNKKFADINRNLFGDDDPRRTQLDWLQAQSRHLILMLDTGQSVRPADLPASTTEALVKEAKEDNRHHPLRSQMRISADRDYITYIRSVLGDSPPPEREVFGKYDLRLFADLGVMRREIISRDKEHGLSRLVAGYAWPWRSRKDKEAVDIEVDGERICWNTKQRDWINSPNSLDEMGSIHTVQGYDLNYAGVVIGNDLRYDPVAGRTFFDRSEYHDAKGRENNPKLGITYSDEDLLSYVRNIYTVLLTRGIRGTYVYVCDPELRRHLERYI